MSTSKPPHRDPNRLKKLYHGEQLTHGEIASRLGVSRQTVHNWMQELGIETRGRGAKKPGASYKNEEELRRLYWEEEMSMAEIGEHFGISHVTVKYWMVKHGIDRREPTDPPHPNDHEVSEKRYEDRELMRRLYIDEQLSQEDIARRLDCCTNTVRRWLRRHDIPVRPKGTRNTDAPWKDEEVLEEMYLEQEMPITQIANAFDVEPNTIVYWLDKLSVTGESDD